LEASSAGESCWKSCWKGPNVSTAIRDSLFQLDYTSARGETCGKRCWNCYQEDRATSSWKVVIMETFG
jgi:hypothetical protein